MHTNQMIKEIKPHKKGNTTATHL